jgi:hypothetical protein
VLKDQLEDARIRRPVKLLIPLYRDVLGKVSSHALLKVNAIYEQYLPIHPQHHTKPSIPDGCTGVTKATIGIPCIHVIKQRYDTGRSLNTRDFHRHWQIVCENEDENQHARESWNLLEPAVVQGKGQPEGASNSKRKNHPLPQDSSHSEASEQEASSQASSAAQRRRGVKRGRIGKVQGSQVPEESQAPSPESPEQEQM